MNNNPLVTIIMPTHNRAYILNKAIKSVLDQTFKDFEFIIVDDGSTDNTEEVVRSFQKTDDRVKYIKVVPKGGAPHARNMGINSSLGTLIAFQDSDVEWFPEKLELQVKEMLSSPNGIGVVYTGFYKVYPQRRLYAPNFLVLKKNGNILKNLLKGNFVDTPSALVRKECFTKAGCFDESLPRLQDWDLFIRIAQYYEFKIIDKPLFNSHYLADSISANNSILFKAALIIFKKYFSLFEREGIVPFFATRHTDIWWKLLLFKLSNKNDPHVS